MIKKLISIIIFSLAINYTVLAQELSTETKNNLPWLDSLIAKGKIGTSIITEIKSYIYNDKLVYLVSYDVGCCDQYSAVLKDEFGNTICHPFGGISGRGDMQCADFLKAKDEKHIWVKENIMHPNINNNQSSKPAIESNKKTFKINKSSN